MPPGFADDPPRHAASDHSSRIHVTSRGTRHPWIADEPIRGRPHPKHHTSPRCRALLTKDPG
ncbi:hypothetical protein HMPREF9154_0741 [Arachnia propionica F0230a]|nr:hypothetical protein HMPREF9154_0741 [Arachnia propionica F0230a]